MWNLKEQPLKAHRKDKGERNGNELQQTLEAVN